MADKDFHRGKRDAENRLPMELPHNSWLGHSKEEIEDNNDYRRGYEAGKLQRERNERNKK